MAISRVLRAVTPPHFRAVLRRSSLVNCVLRLAYGGTRSIQHPDAPYKIYYDGYRVIGWSVGGLYASEASELSFIREVLKIQPCKCVWDVGANVGLWSLFFAGIQPPIEQIICFEPDETNLRYLRMNKEKNSINAIEIRALAVSSRSGELTFFADPMTGATGSLEAGCDFLRANYNAKRCEVTVPVTTVDEQIASGTPVPELMKIDVEGHELDLLRGATAMFRHHRPMLMLEVTQHHDEITSLLRDLDYRLIEPATRTWMDGPHDSTFAVPARLSDTMTRLIRSS